MSSFSIITPTLFGNPYLSEAIESVANQQGLDSPAEHLLVVAEDRVATLEFPELSHPPRILIRPRKGPADAFNRGLWQSKGEWIGCLADDDIYYPNTLARVAALAADHADVQVIYGGVDIIDEQSVAYHCRKAKRISLRRLKRRDLVDPSAIFFRRRLLEQIGPLDSKLSYCYWHDFLLRVFQRGYRTMRADFVACGRRRHRGNRQLGNPDPTLHLARCEEQIGLLKKRIGKIPNAVALRFGQCIATMQGIDQTMGGYDRVVLQSAIKIRRSHEFVNPITRTISDTGLLISHGRNQLIHGLRYPHDVTRFLPAPMRPGFRAFCRSRLFQLRQHEPRPSRFLVNPTGAPVTDPISIGIVTPNLNAGRTLARTIESVLGQGYPALQYVVQDGRSSDDSLEVISVYADRLHHWDSCHDTGQANAINLGMRHVTSEIMAYLNSDDLLLPNSLAYVSQFFRNRPDVDVIYGHRLIIDEQDREVGRWILPKHDDKAIAFADYIPQETMFWRRRAWERVGGKIDESFQFALDWDLILRFRNEGMKFERVPRFLGAFRLIETQKTQVLLETLGETEMNRLRRREFGRIPTAREKRRHLRSYRWRQWIQHHAHSLWDDTQT